MKNGKTIGPDGILVEVWKSQIDMAVEFLTKLFNMIMEIEKMPEKWTTYILVRIF